MQICSTGHRYRNFATRFSSRWVHFVPFLHVARPEICSSDTLTQCVISVYRARTVWKSACFLRRREQWDISLNELHSQCNWKKSDGGPVVFSLAAMEISLACVDISDWPTLKKEAERTVFWRPRRSPAWSAGGTGTLFRAFPTFAKHLWARWVSSAFPSAASLFNALCQPSRFLFQVNHVFLTWL